MANYHASKSRARHENVGHLMYFPKNNTLENEIRKFVIWPELERLIGTSWTNYEVTKVINRYPHVRYIFIRRDPRDVIISYYFMLKDRPQHPLFTLFSRSQTSGTAIAIESLIKAMHITRLNMPDIYFRMYEGWLSNNRTLCCKYENLIGALGNEDENSQLQEIKKIINWIGVKDNQLPGGLSGVVENISTPKVNKQGHFRDGTTKQWKKIFNNRTKDTFKEYYPNLVERWGYSW